MNSETWIKALHAVKVLCAIDKPAQADYVQGMYNELQPKFTDEQIMAAARTIAEKEELYGNYPSLRVWMKYCPQKQAAQVVNDRLKTEFLDQISAIMYLDHIIFDHSETEKRLKANFGWKGYNTFKRTGLSLKNLRGYHHASEAQKNQILEKFGRAWDEADNTDPRLKEPVLVLPSEVKVLMPGTTIVEKKE